MRKLILLTAVTLISSYTFAATYTGNHSSSLSSLGSSFRSHATTAPKIDPNDITMGYAGQDVSHKLDNTINAA